jgi:hypothetical protein
MVAANVGWWVYPFVLILCFFAFLGIGVLILAVLGRVNIGSHQVVKNKIKLADEIQQLSDEMGELFGEYLSEREQTRHAHSEKWLTANNPGEIDVWAENRKLNDRILGKYGRMFHSRFCRVVIEARMHVGLGQSTRSVLNSPFSADSLGLHIAFLNELSLRLRHGWQPKVVESKQELLEYRG